MKPLTDYENVMLRSIAGQSRRGSGWAEPPRTETVSSALRHLAGHGMVIRKPGAWWLVRATQKAFRHIEAQRKGKLYRAKARLDYLPNNGAERS